MTTRTKTVKVQFYVSATDTSVNPNITAFSCDMTSYGYVKLGEQEVTFTFDPEAQTRAQISLLEARIKETQADAEQRITEYRGMIQSLLALPSA